MAATFSGLYPVRWSLYALQGNQVAQIDLNLSACVPSFDLEWSSTDFFAYLSGNGVYSAFADCMTDNATVIGSKLYLKVGSVITVATDPITHISGTAGSDPMPSQVAGLYRWFSNQGGPKGRGRDYFPFLDTSASVAGKASVTYQSLMAAFAMTIAGGINLPNVFPGSTTPNFNIYRCTKAIFGTPTPVPARMTSNIAAEGFATQKRRGYFGKPNSTPF